MIEVHFRLPLFSRSPVEGKLDAEKEREIDQLKLTMNLNGIPTWLSTVNMMGFIVGLAFAVMDYSPLTR